MAKMRLLINRNECDEIAEKLFLEYSGIGRGGKRRELMKKKAFHLRDGLLDNIHATGMYAYYPEQEIELDERNLMIEGRQFCCSAFEQIDSSCVKGAYVYVVSVKGFDMNGETAINQLYGDLWGTAYVEAVRCVLRNRLQQKNLLSVSFGPGFYGMPMEEMAEIDTLLFFKDIGLTLSASNMIIPLKSCAGIVFAVDEKYVPPEAACKSCNGNHRSCELCSVLRRKSDV